MEGSFKNLELDGQTRCFDSERTFGEVSDEIKTILAPDRVMTEILVDGKFINIEEEAELNGSRFGDLGDVSIRSRDVSELFVESLQTAPRICEAMRLDCQDIDEMFESNQVAAAQERVGELTALLEWLLQLVTGMEALGVVRVKDMTFSRGHVITAMNRMQELLMRLHTELARQNHTEFRKILKGEFMDEVGVWEILFKEVSETWQARPSSHVS